MTIQTRTVNPKPSESGRATTSLRRRAMPVTAASTPEESHGPAVPHPSDAVRASFAATIANLDLAQTRPVADALSRRLGDDGLLYVMGCGHSYLLALEGFYRAGAPAWVAPLSTSA